MIHRNEHITTSIVPSTVRYYTLPDSEVLDLKAICCFAATGFFLDDDTYYLNQKAFRPATSYSFDAQGNVIKKERYFKWHYAPRKITFTQALEEFTYLLEDIVKRNVQDRRVIIPISGGLDSRTLAATLADSKQVFAYSYQFEGGPHENYYGSSVANSLAFPYQAFEISKGYLWGVIKDLALLNRCYAEFINPRQMAIWQQVVTKGDIFLLGHGGDLFFDSMGVPDDLSTDEQNKHLLKKLIKPSGWELGEELWKAWGLEGNFREYLKTRIEQLLNTISIENANARLRAFKTEFYVARWTAVNLEIFERQLPVCMPFFDDDMCKFICMVPEEHLANRRIEIEYLKAKSPALASLPWQKYYPCNLYNYSDFDTFPYKIKRGIIKGKREIKKYLLGNRSDARNWELQFLGKSNDPFLQSYLFDNSLEQLLPSSIPKKFYKLFQRDAHGYAHSITMLLTLSLFSRLFLNKR